MLFTNNNSKKNDSYNFYDTIRRKLPFDVTFSSSLLLESSLEEDSSILPVAVVVVVLAVVVVVLAVATFLSLSLSELSLSELELALAGFRFFWLFVALETLDFAVIFLSI